MWSFWCVSTLILLIYSIDFFSTWLALVEYHCSDEKNIASRIFAHEAEFMLRYLGFPISINDTAVCLPSFSSPVLGSSLKRFRSSRCPSAFEGAVTQHRPPTLGAPIRYEYQYCDLDAAQKLGEYIATVCPEGTFYLPYPSNPIPQLNTSPLRTPHNFCDHE